MMINGANTIATNCVITQTVFLDWSGNVLTCLWNKKTSKVDPHKDPRIIGIQALG